MPLASDMRTRVQAAKDARQQQPGQLFDQAVTEIGAEADQAKRVYQYKLASTPVVRDQVLDMLRDEGFGIRRISGNEHEISW